jgi:hypothetical protein
LICSFFFSCASAFFFFAARFAARTFTKVS